MSGGTPEGRGRRGGGLSGGQVALRGGVGLGPPPARPPEWRGGEEERISGSPSNEKVAVVLVSFASNPNSAEFR